jgi:hypothetical protein
MFLFAVTWFIFNLHIKNIYLFDIKHTYIICYNIQNMHEFIMKEKEKNISLGMVALCIWQRIPILAGPLFKANCPILSPPPSPIALYPVPTLPPTQHFCTYGRHKHARFFCWAQGEIRQCWYDEISGLSTFLLYREQLLLSLEWEESWWHPSHLPKKR